MKLADGFGHFSRWWAGALGSPAAFVINCALIMMWLASGPFFQYSDTWQLVVNTVTTVFTYLAVFLIQNTQNRDATAVHLKLDELISSIEGARNRFVDLEDLTDEELRTLRAQFQKLRARARNAGDEDCRAIAGDPDSEPDPAPRAGDPVAAGTGTGKPPRTVRR